MRSIIGAPFAVALAGCVSMSYGDLKPPETVTESDVRTCFGPVVETRVAGTFTSIERYKKNDCVIDVYHRADGSIIIQSLHEAEAACRDEWEDCGH